MRICCDLDGVLIDFGTPTIAKMNEVLNDESHPLNEMAREALAVCGDLEFGIPHIDSTHVKSCKAARTYMKALIGDDEEFWTNLPWRESGKRLWSHVREYDDVIIITSPMPWDGSINGRLKWIERELGVTRDRIFLTYDHSKGEYAIDEEGNPCVLIDDWIGNIEEFLEAGGHTIYFNCLYKECDDEDVNMVISKLEEYLDESRSN